MMRPKPNAIFNQIDKIERVPLKALKSPPKMLRAYTKVHIRSVSRCIEQFGFLCPPLVDGEGTIIAGLMWFLAAQSLELPDIPVVRVEHQPKSASPTKLPSSDWPSLHRGMTTIWAKR